MKLPNLNPGGLSTQAIVQDVTAITVGVVALLKAFGVL